MVIAIARPGAKIPSHANVHNKVYLAEHNALLPIEFRPTTQYF
jgi:hypothetical protein